MASPNIRRAVSAALVAVVALQCAVREVSAQVGTKPNVLPVVRVMGDHYDVGYQHGVVMAPHIATVLSFIGPLRAYVGTDPGKTLFADLVKRSTDQFPNAAQEIAGIAAGSNQTLDDIWMLNMKDELGPLAAPHDKNLVDYGCSEVAVPLSNGQFLDGHNEDSGMSDYTNTFWMAANVSANPDVGDAHDINYGAYTYAGQLATNAFGVNEHGVYMSTNALFPTAESFNTKAGFPRNIVQRYVLSAASLDEALERAKTTPTVSGFSLNLGSFASDNMPRVQYNIELSPSGPNVLKIDESWFRANMYLHSPGVPQYNSTSSVHREAAASKLPKAQDANGIFTILGDRSDQQWPIYRNAAAPDDAITIITALFDTEAQSIGLFLNNPHTTVYGPLMTVRWPADIMNT